MNITILGAAGGELPGLHLTGFKIDEALLLDAGTIGHALSLDEQLAIKHILITHAHLDHIHALPFLLDNLIGRIDSPIKVYSTIEIIEAIKVHIFNNKIWPDFTVLPTSDKPVLEFCPIKPNEHFQIEQYRIQAIQVNHSFMALAYVITDHSGTVVFSGDTGPVDELWQQVKSIERLGAVFMECSFPTSMQDLAKMTSHLSVSDIIDELSKAEINQHIPIYLYHLKPAFTVEIAAEVNNLLPEQIRVTTSGEHVTI